MTSSIAFVGAGPATIYTLHALLNRATSPFTLTIFEEQATAGRGTPYRPGWKYPAMLSNIASIEIPPLEEPLIDWLPAQPESRLIALGADPEEIGERTFYHLTRRDGTDVELADNGKDICFETSGNEGSIARRPREHSRLKPFAGDPLEAVDRPIILSTATHLGRVETDSELISHHLAPRASGEQRRSGIEAAREKLLVVLEPIGEAPNLRPIRLDDNVKAATIGSLVRLIGGLEGFDRAVGKHVGIRSAKSGMESQSGQNLLVGTKKCTNKLPETESRRKSPAAFVRATTCSIYMKIKLYSALLKHPKERLAAPAGWGGRIRTCEWRHQKPPSEFSSCFQQL